MQQTLVFVAVLIVAVAIYWPILKKARTTIGARSAAGLGNGVLFAVLLIPLFGPIIYLVFHKRFQVE